MTRRFSAAVRSPRQTARDNAGTAHEPGLAHGESRALRARRAVFRPAVYFPRPAGRRT